MPVASIPLDRGQASGLDALTGAAQLSLNMLVVGPPGQERTRAVRTRPGIKAWSAFPATFPSADPVVRMTSLAGHIIYVTDDGAGTRKVFGLTNTGTIVDMSLIGASANVPGTEPITMHPWRDFVFIAGGGVPQKVSAGFTSDPLGGGAPAALDLCVIAQRLVVVSNDRFGTIFWNTIPGEAGVETWDLDFDWREAEARPDPLVAANSTARELWAFGTESTQIFIPDGTEIFATANTLEYGCIAKRGVIRVGNMMAWLDENKQIVISNGASVEVLSDRGISATIDEFETVSDCWAFRAKIGPFDLAAWVFPTVGRTFCWDMVSQTWSEWRRLDAYGQWQPWAPTSYLKAWGAHLVGMPDGSIAQLALDAYSDLGDPLGWTLRTGFQEVTTRRHCTEARFTCQRGQASSSSSAIGVRWRDDLGAFTPRMDLALGTPGDNAADVVIAPAGAPYRRREWELSGSAADAYVIAVGKETYEEADF